jgi:hypothetical protein
LNHADIQLLATLAAAGCANGTASKGCLPAVTFSNAAAIAAGTDATTG